MPRQYKISDLWRGDLTPEQKLQSLKGLPKQTIINYTRGFFAPYASGRDIASELFVWPLKASLTITAALFIIPLVTALTAATSIVSLLATLPMAIFKRNNVADAFAIGAVAGLATLLIPIGATIAILANVLSIAFTPIKALARLCASINSKSKGHGFFVATEIDEISTAAVVASYHQVANDPSIFAASSYGHSTYRAFQSSQARVPAGRTPVATNGLFSDRQAGAGVFGEITDGASDFRYV